MKVGTIVGVLIIAIIIIIIVLKRNKEKACKEKSKEVISENDDIIKDNLNDENVIPPNFTNILYNN